MSQLNSVTQKRDVLLRDDVPGADAGVEHGLHPRQVAERDVVGDARVMARAASRVRVVRPDVEMRLLAAGGLELLREAEHRSEEQQRARAPGRAFACSRRERRGAAGDDEVVRMHGVDGVGECVQHRAVPDRRVEGRAHELRSQVDGEVGLVPQLPVADAREALDIAAVAARRGLRERASLAGDGLYGPAADSASGRPRRSARDVDDRLQSLPAPRRGSARRSSSSCMPDPRDPRRRSREGSSPVRLPASRGQPNDGRSRIATSLNACC